MGAIAHLSDTPAKECAVAQDSSMFVPGHVRLVEALVQVDQPEAALEVLEVATNRYLSQPDLLRAQVTALTEQEEWLGASIAAHQFALLNPDHPEMVSCSSHKLKAWEL